MKSAQAITTTIRRHRSSRSQRAATRLVHRVGFTLVELLMVIVIIGILVSMLVVAVNPVLRTSREFAVTQEMKQMDLAIENFQNKYGFYPPSFTGLTAATDVLPYLNKLSPNHREATPGFLGGLSRLQVWWNAIGSKLDDRGSLIFWLGGLSTNKQFPITGGLGLVDLSGDPDNPLVAGTNFAQLPVIFNADSVIAVDSLGVVQQAANATGEIVDEFGVVGAFEREAGFDFRVAQLSSDGADAGIRIYNSPYGNAKGDLAYRYRNSAFYGTAPIAFHVNTDSDPVFPNPRTFQISTLGLDGEVSPFFSSQINQPAPENIPSGNSLSDWSAPNNDNIANFANGRLDGFDWTEAVDLGGRNPR